LEHNDATQVHGGSQLRYGPNIVKDWQLGEERIMHDTFVKTLFMMINNFIFLIGWNIFYSSELLILWMNVILIWCNDEMLTTPSTLQKCTTSIQMFVYSVATNALDEYYCMGQSKTMESLKWFVKAMR
jgi:hypothetical protein